MSAFKSFEIAGWSEAGMANRYDKVAGRLARIAVTPILDALDVQAGERFLDVATGPGHLAGYTRGWFRAQAPDVQLAVREAFAARLAPYRRGRLIVLPVSARIAVTVH